MAMASATAMASVIEEFVGALAARDLPATLARYAPGAVFEPHVPGWDGVTDDRDEIGAWLDSFFICRDGFRVVLRDRPAGLRRRHADRHALARRRWRPPVPLLPETLLRPRRRAHPRPPHVLRRRARHRRRGGRERRIAHTLPHRGYEAARRGRRGDRRRSPPHQAGGGLEHLPERHARRLRAVRGLAEAGRRLRRGAGS